MLSLFIPPFFQILFGKPINIAKIGSLTLFPILLSCSTCFGGCSSSTKITANDLVGLYHVSVDDGEADLILNPNGTYQQVFTSRKSKDYSRPSGEWTIETTSNPDYPYNLVLNNALKLDGNMGKNGLPGKHLNVGYIIDNSAGVSDLLLIVDKDSDLQFTRQKNR